MIAPVPVHCFSITFFFLLSIRPSIRGQLVKSLITLEPHGTFRSNFAYLYILTLSVTSIQDGDEAVSRIRLAGRGQLVKTLITLESHGVF